MAGVLPLPLGSGGAFLIERLVPTDENAVRARRRYSAASTPSGTPLLQAWRPKADDRGRDATSPAEIPATGWKDILWRVYANIGDHRILALAAGMTYYSILAIFPALAALVAIYGIFTDAGSIAKHLDDVSGFVPGGAIDVAREQLTRVSSKSDRALGLTFLLGLVISLWSANAAMKSLFDTLNIVYGEQRETGLLQT